MGPAVTRKMMSFAAVYVSLALLFHRSSVEAKCGNPGLYFPGDDVKILCRIQGTYSWPEWKKWKKEIQTITNEGIPLINPVYAARWSYDIDNTTLIITNVEKSDEGLYVCASAGKEDSPKTFELIVEEATNAGGLKSAVAVFFVLVILVLFLIIIRQCYILFKIYKEVKWTKRSKKKIKGIRIRKYVSILILIIAAGLFITVLAWFIVIRATEEDCEKLTKKDNYFYLLTFEVIAFMLGVSILVYAYIVWWKMKHLRRRIQQIIDSAFIHNVTEEDLDMLLRDVKWANIVQQLMELEKEGKIIWHRYYGRIYCFRKVSARRAYLERKIQEIFKSAFPQYFPAVDLSRVSGYKTPVDELLQESSVSSRLRRENIEKTLRMHKQNYPYNVSDTDLGDIVSIVSYILHQETEKQMSDAMDSQKNLIKQIIGPLFEPQCPNASAAELLSGITSYVTVVIFLQEIRDDPKSSRPYISTAKWTQTDSVRSKIRHIFLLAFSQYITKEDLDRLDSSDTLFEGLFKGADKWIYCIDTGQKMKENYSDIIRQFLKHAYSDILTDGDLGKGISVIKDIIERELELERNSNFRSRQWGLVDKGHGTKINLIRISILQYVGPLYRDAWITDLLCGIISYVEEVIIGQHLEELKRDDLNSSTHDGFVINISETRVTLKNPTDSGYVDTERNQINIVRWIIHQIFQQAFADYLTAENLYWVLWAEEIIEQQLKGSVGWVYCIETGRKMKGIDCERIRQFLEQIFFGTFTDKDLGDIVIVAKDIIDQELEKLKRDDSVISQHGARVLWDHKSKLDYMRKHILSCLCNQRPNFWTTAFLCGIIAYVEEVIIEQHLKELKRGDLITSTQDGFVSNFSEKQWNLINIVRITLQTILKSAMPDYLTAEDFHSFLVQDTIIEKQLKGCVRGIDGIETGRKMEENYSERILQRLQLEYPGIFKREYLGKIIREVKDIIEQTLVEDQLRDDMATSQRIGRSLEKVRPKLELIKETIHQIINHRYYEARKSQILCGIIAYVEEVIIGHFSKKLKRDDLIGSTQDGFTSNISKTDHCLSGLPEPTGGDHSPTEL